ncbi:MAG: protein-export membrane protein SecF [Candidatus Spechtbacteria bacterium RIFCSPLOWO2_01_FULL_43_12]|uniref:Protein-export membrane protein SecF n=1 Tax=Candidatus Spechtbacteria bacterium RIFCSPLOWO2_01_FULL_43_12 TaxID=1802162 RepID=A0A1G2HEF9_9BACT|nr:MAG: protein-export membrane protein SecF [Candidatus Spechtbacteria bacterium RIFCSPLOWO2_01_FULL_43_12]
MIKRRKIFYAFSTILIVASIISLAIFRLPLGIDFKGGSIMELTFESDEGGRIPSGDEIRAVLSGFSNGTVTVQSSGENSFILRFDEITEETHIAMLERLEGLEGASAREERFDSIGPTIGAETTRKSLQAMGLVIVMVAGYVAWAFRRVKYPLSSTRWGVVVLVALFHDVLITAGAFSIFAHFVSAEVGVPFIAAMLTILGYSVTDTIVVFDRIRENLLRFGSKISFGELAEKSVRETIVRSLNVSLTTIFVLVSILFLGGATLRDFMLVLIIGIAVGTYSSIALASPMLVSWANRKS